MAMEDNNTAKQIADLEKQRDEAAGTFNGEGVKNAEDAIARLREQATNSKVEITEEQKIQAGSLDGSEMGLREATDPMDKEIVKVDKAMEAVLADAERKTNALNAEVAGGQMTVDELATRDKSWREANGYSSDKLPEGMTGGEALRIQAELNKQQGELTHTPGSMSYAHTRMAGKTHAEALNTQAESKSKLETKEGLQAKLDEAKKFQKAKHAMSRWQDLYWAIKENSEVPHVMHVEKWKGEDGPVDDYKAEMERLENSEELAPWKENFKKEPGLNGYWSNWANPIALDLEKSYLDFLKNSGLNEKYKVYDVVIPSKLFDEIPQDLEEEISTLEQEKEKGYSAKA